MCMNQKAVVFVWVHQCHVFGMTTLSIEHECKGCGQSVSSIRRRDPSPFNPCEYRPSNEFTRNQQEYLLNQHRFQNWKNKMKQLEETKHV